MPKYRKKPVVIEAIQWDALAETWNLIQEMGCPSEPGDDDAFSFYIPTLEGKMLCSLMDYVIKGVKGEFYPCKPDIFEQSYELVES